MEHSVSLSSKFLPLVSVIIPVYNAKHTLEKAVHSVLSQNYENLELLLINDCSTDGSTELCNALAAKHSVIKAIHQPQNMGAEHLSIILVRLII